jgi:hypothetical protein
MSTKTLRKRIALAAVTALGAGLLSVVSTPAANAFTEYGETNILAVAVNNSDTATAVLATTASGSFGFGVLAVDTSTTLAGTATMLSNGTIVVSSGVATTATAAFIVTGGTIVAQSANVTVAQDQRSANLLNVAAVKTVAIKPSAGVTSMVISLVTGTAAVPTGLKSRLTVTVVGTNTLGAFSAADSLINTASSITGTDSVVVDGVDQVNATTGSATAIPNGGTGKINFSLKDAFGNAATASVVTASSTAGGFVKLSASDTDFAVASPAGTSAVDVAATRNAGSVTVTQAVANVPVTVTVTLAYRGVTFATKTFAFQGEVAKVTVTPSKVGKTSASNADAANVVYTDSAGNTLFPTDSTVATTVVTASMGDQTIVNGVTVANYPSRTATGKVTVSCNATSGTVSALQVAHLNAASGTIVRSNTWAQTCAGAATSVTGSWDKASYTPGSIAVLTLSFKDSKGFAANSYDLLDTMTITGSPSSTTAQAGAAVTPLNPHAARGGGITGTITQTYVVGSTTGDFVAVVVPADSLKTAALAAGTSQANLSVAYKIASGTTTVTNEQVLASIVSLIASINKQIVALQKLILKRR